MNERDWIYVQILSFGLPSLRNASFAGDVAYWKIEADHLHNVPSLIGETNELRHAYYFEQERTAYLSAVQGKKDADFALQRYRELWAQLEQYNSQK